MISFGLGKVQEKWEKFGYFGVERGIWALKDDKSLRMTNQE